jgi:hypothetical protein
VLAPPDFILNSALGHSRWGIDFKTTYFAKKIIILFLGSYVERGMFVTEQYGFLCKQGMIFIAEHVLLSANLLLGL